MSKGIVYHFSSGMGARDIVLIETGSWMASPICTRQLFIIRFRCLANLNSDIVGGGRGNIPQLPLYANFVNLDFSSTRMVLNRFVGQNTTAGDIFENQVFMAGKRQIVDQAVWVIGSLELACLPLQRAIILFFKTMFWC